MNADRVPHDPADLKRMIIEGYDEDLADLIAIAWLYGDGRSIKPYNSSMVVRKTSRIEVRVSEEDRRFLEERLRESGQSISGWVQHQIDDEREAVDLAERRAAFERLCSMNVEWIPDDPADLKRMIIEGYDEDLADLIAIA